MMGHLVARQLAVRSPEFEYNTSDVIALEMEVQIGQPGEKLKGLSTITLRTNQISGYDMKVMVQKSGSDAWCQPIEVGAISIQVRGEYERQILIAAFQKIGLMTLPAYGRIEHGPFELSEEEQDALYQQTPPI
jgi:hypothetical protein